MQSIKEPTIPLELPNAPQGEPIVPEEARREEANVEESRTKVALAA